MIQLRKVVALGRINLLRQVRDRSDLFFLLVLPTIIIVALGLQFGGTSRARLGVVAPAGDVAAESVLEALAADGLGFDIRRVADEDALVDQVERGQVEAGIAIPDAFTAGLQGTGTVEIRYLGTTDALAAGLQAPVSAAVAELGAVTTATRVAVDDGLADWPTAQDAAASRYETVPGVEVSVTLIGEPGAFAGFSQFTFGASTQLILFMFLTSMTAAGRLVHTKQLGLSRRMVSTPTSAWTVVAGEALGRYLVAMLQAAYIVAVTSLAFGVTWGDPIAAALIVALFGLVAAGAAMLVGALSRNGDQASSLGVFVGLALGALGGCMVPWQAMPDAMQAISRFIPHSWALLGLQELIRTGGDVATVAPNLGVLAAYGAVLMGLAGWRFRKAITG